MNENNLHKDILAPLIQFFDNKNLDELNRIFYNEHIHENDDLLVGIDKNENKVTYLTHEYATGKEIFYEYSFQDFIAFEKSKLYEQLEIAIREIFREYFNDKIRLIKFKNKINVDINFIIRTQQLLFNTYPFLKRFLNDFISMLYRINLFDYKGYPFPLNPDYIPPFKFKANWAKREDIKNKFNRFRTLLYRYDIIQSEDISEDDFFSVFSGDETNKSISFVCESPIATKILQLISHLYVNFSAIEIENSKRFFTRTNKILTRSNYGTQLNRLHKKGITEIEAQLFLEINKIFYKKKQLSVFI